MKVVFYSTTTNGYDASSFHYTSYRSRADELETLSEAFPEHSFGVVTDTPGFFLIDLESDGAFTKKASHVAYDVTDAGRSLDASQTSDADNAAYADKACAAAFAERIVALSPNLVIAASFWMTPLDWLPLQDALVADELRARGIRVLCHSTETVALCFDKQEMHRFLVQHDFHAARALHLKLALFWAERGNRGAIKSNPYKEMLLKQLETLKYPVVIKDTTGLSSFGMDVAPTAKAARAILLSRKTNGDRLIEEYISGTQFGVEVYGTPGNYTVMTPFMFSVTRYGITSPKQSVKLSVSGDDAERRFKLDEMRKTVLALSEALRLEGAAQFDLVFSGAAGLEIRQGPSEQIGGWYIIEVNTRLSGLSVPTAVLAGKSVHCLLLETALSCGGSAAGLESVHEPACNAVAQKANSAPACVLDVKLSVLAEEHFDELCALPYVYAVNQTANDGARQIREKGYCEVVIGAPSYGKLLERLDELKALFPDELDDAFVENAHNLISQFL